jgi:MFS transporter, DHA3 family, multidrug efflux protein
MNSVLILAIAVTILTIIHLLTVSVPEKHIVTAAEAMGGGETDGGEPAEASAKAGKIDIKGTLKVVSSVPGLLPLILFATFNNFLGGVFMSLMDAYGLSMVSVQTWGLLWGFLSTAFIIGGILIAKFGLGKNPVRSLFLANITIWIVCSVFTLNQSLILLTVGMFIYLCVAPFIEASEHTIIQKVVPPERLGRVFGFAQSVEQSASPLTAFIIGPLTQFFFIPFMTTGKGVNLIGSWFGTGPSRGMALVFTVAGVIGLLVTLLAMSSKYYKQLSERYLAE